MFGLALMKLKLRFKAVRCPVEIRQKCCRNQQDV